MTHILCLPVPYDVDGLHRACLRVFPRLGGMLVRAWPSIDEWLDQIVPEPFYSTDTDVRSEYTLTESVLKDTLAPELSEIYSIQSAGAFARLLLAAFRHSELTAIFFPASIDKRQIGKLCHAADYYEFDRHKKGLPQVPWLLGVGLAANEPNSFLIATASQDVMTSLLEDLVGPPRGFGPFTLWIGRENG